jgi:hypothetical protein
LGSALMEMKMSLVMGSSRLRSDRIVGTFFGGGWVGFGCVCGCVCLPLFFWFWLMVLFLVRFDCW